MTGAAKGGGFFVGAIGGLALALLLVGAVSFLPQSSTALHAVSAPTKSAGLPGSGAVATSTTTTCTSCQIAFPYSSTQSGGNNAAVNVPSAAGAAVSPSTTSSSASSSSQIVSSNPPTAPSPVLNDLQQQRPKSLLTVLPGESVGSLIATLSPLLIGLLVAALIYGAYSRRQDSSS